tara:strand:- start:2857 stop:3111 length:255 start_codon:yes stop_codon:yes gene_type:complete
MSAAVLLRLVEQEALVAQVALQEPVVAALASREQVALAYQGQAALAFPEQVALALVEGPEEGVNHCHLSSSYPAPCVHLSLGGK